MCTFSADSSRSASLGNRHPSFSRNAVMFCLRSGGNQSDLKVIVSNRKVACPPRLQGAGRGRLQTILRESQIFISIKSQIKNVSARFSFCQRYNLINGTEVGTKTTTPATRCAPPPPTLIHNGGGGGGGRRCSRCSHACVARRGARVDRDPFRNKFDLRNRSHDVVNRGEAEGEERRGGGEPRDEPQVYCKMCGPTRGFVEIANQTGLTSAAQCTCILITTRWGKSTVPRQNQDEKWSRYLLLEDTSGFCPVWPTRVPQLCID